MDLRAVDVKTLEFDLTVSVLLIAFNRPDITSQVFSRIRAAKPQKLYVSIDGAREGNEDDEILVDKVKSIVTNVDWPCDTHYKFNGNNRGAEVTISAAINWVFEKEEYTIILEDDIIAPLSFFRFAQEMLIKYKNHPQIATVSGSNFTPLPDQRNDDYIFARYGQSWGWATWKRAWKGFDLNIEIPEEHVRLSFLKTLTNSRIEAKYFQKLFSRMRKNGAGKSTWDYIGLYRHRINNSLSIIPRVNLTSNIGVYGLHANGRTEHHYRAFNESFIVRRHPDKVEYNIEYDKHHFKNYLYVRKPIVNRIINKLNRYLDFLKKFQ